MPDHRPLIILIRTPKILYFSHTLNSVPMAKYQRNAKRQFPLSNYNLILNKFHNGEIRSLLFWFLAGALFGVGGR